jgi:hypothetical protein
LSDQAATLVSRVAVREDPETAVAVDHERERLEVVLGR